MTDTSDRENPQGRDPQEQQPQSPQPRTPEPPAPPSPAAPAPEPGQGRTPGPPPPTRGRRPPVARWAASSGLYVAVVIAVLVVANALGAQAHRRVDLTANHQYTLSAPTLKVLHELRQPLQIYGFLQSGSSIGQSVHSLLQEYQAAGAGKVSVHFVDPASHPAEARRYGVVQYNEVVVVAGTNHATATPSDMYTYSPTGQQVFNGEAAVTNAILRAANPKHLTVYFLQGDGERQLQQNYSSVDRALSDQGYGVQTLNLIQRPAVPSGAAAVVIAGPTHDLAGAEVKALQAYANRGGHLLVLLDPVRNVKLTHLYRLLAGVGVQVRNDIVVDPAAGRHYQTDAAALVPAIESQAITTPLSSAHTAVLLPASLSLSPATGDSAYKETALFKTSASAYAKTNVNTSSIAPGKGDLKGPFDLGLAVTSTKKGDGFRAVVLGSSSFALNNTVGIQGNRDLFLNSIGWLTGRAEGIRIRPRPALSDQVFLTGQTMSELFYGYVFLLPALALIGGAVVWSWRRRL